MAHIPSDAEFGILTVLWRCGPSTVREVHEALAKDTGYTSTLKQMQVMHERGLLRRSERYRSHVYEAAVTREEAQARFAGDLMHRVFEGSARNLVLGALTAQRASAEDLEAMRRMFDEFEKKEEAAVMAPLSEFQAQRLGWTLLHFLWQGTAIVVVYAMLRRMLGRSLGAQGRYALACAALLTMTAAPPLTFLLIPDGRGMGSWTISAAASQRLLSGVVALWLLGVIAFSIRLLGGWRFAASLRATSHPAPAEWQRTLEGISGRIGAVRLLVSSLVDVPTVIGWLRPAILVPVEFLTGLPVEHITALLAHEIAHIRRHDYLASILQSIAETVLFYHPAVWWISEQIRAERELCCDDLAVATTGDVLAYARALAELESRQPSHCHAVLAANGGSLVNRIRRLIEPAHAIANNLPGPGAAWAMTLLWLAGVGVVAFHGAQTPVVRATIAPVALSTPARVVTVAGKARHSLLYDPLLPEPPALPLETVPVPEIKLEDPPEPVVIAKNMDDVIPFHVTAPAVPEPAPARPTFRTAPTFHTTTRLVQVDVVARRKGTPAIGLTSVDFTLLDNGKPQKIALFSVSSSQAPGPASVPLPTGAVSNRLESGGEQLPNATVLLIDQKNTAQVDQAFAIRRIVKFLRARRRQDRIGIYVFSSDESLHVLQEITDDTGLLSHAANSLKARDPHYKDWGAPDRVPDRAMDTKHVLESIARHLASVPGRKSLVWVTTSFPLLPHANLQPDFDVQSPMEEAARALNDANVAIYAVDARGLVGALSGMTAISNAEFGGPQSPAQLEQQMHAGGGFLSGADTMSRLADLTGGLVLYNANAIEDSIREALDDSELTYTLGFYPAREEQNGAWHKLKVAVAKHGVKVRYRERYFASRTPGEASGRPTLAELLKGPLDATQLELVTETLPDRARPGFWQVRASIDLHDVHLENQNHNWVGAVDVSFLTEGSQTARTFTKTVEIPEEQLSTALDRGIVVDDSVALGELSSVVHVVAQDRATGAAGTVSVPLGSR